MNLIAKDSGLALLAFKIGQHQFDINRGLAYISMRDQIIRARTLIHSAFSAEIFSAADDQAHGSQVAHPDVDVLVIGGGVGGVSAALAAAELGLKTMLVEKNAELFPLLRRGSSRLVSTTVYDWPSLHYSEHSFPRISAFAPPQPGIATKTLRVLQFPDSPKTPAELADELSQQLVKHEAELSDVLIVRRGMEVPVEEPFSWKQNRRCVVVTLKEPTQLFGPEKKNHFHTRIVVFAVGFGAEKALNQSSGTINDSFWGYSTLEADLDGFGHNPADVVVTGGGDGGLQEALRAVLRPEYHDLAKLVRQLELTIGDDLQHWGRAMIEIQCAENNAGRALMWGYEGGLIFPRLDEVYEKAVKELIIHHEAQLEEWRASVSRSRPLSVTLVEKHLVSGRVYPLNRFLFKLLSATNELCPLPIATLRLVNEDPHAVGALRIDRSGLEPLSSPYGTAMDDDYLRRAIFRSIPNHYSVIA